MAEKKIKNPERGAASINVELEDSIITVRHGEDRSILYQKTAHDGDWDKIWKAIKNKKSEKKMRRL